MSSLRLPTMRQLEKMGRDAGTVLDFIESELEKAISGLPKQDHNYARYRRNLKASLRRVQKRRDEFLQQRVSC